MKNIYRKSLCGAFLISIKTLALKLFISFALILMGSAATAKEPQPTTCSVSQFRGAPTLKSREYMFNPYVWVVTREFAKRFCMPEEYIDDTLKGAEAIAYSQPTEPDRVVCQFKEGKEVCNTPRRGEHRLDIYIKTGTLKQYDSTVDFYVRHLGGSSRLIEPQRTQENYDLDDDKIPSYPAGNRRPFLGIGPKNAAAKVHFNYSSLLTEARAQIHATAPFEEQFHRNWVKGIDFISIGMSASGDIQRKCTDMMPKFGYAIAVASGTEGFSKLIQSDYEKNSLHLIYIPKKVAIEINKLDCENGERFDRAIRGVAEEAAKTYKK
jgi:hypothetical protein